MEYLEHAWAAGLFDGEGSTSVYKSGQQKWLYPRLSMGQKDPEVLERMLTLFGGQIYRDRTRPMYQWNLNKQDHVMEALNMMWPFLSEVKKRQAIEVYRKVDEDKQGRKK
jgi:hypothetical protein